MGRNRRGVDRYERERDRDAGDERRKTEKCQYDDADTAFILGRGGKTKQKICRVSGATLDLHERNNLVDISGTEEERRKARKYIDLVRAQRVGPVDVDASMDDGDLTMMDVPTGCVGFVTGSGGNFLRSCEDEWGTLMFFCNYTGPSEEHRNSERLAIFGSPPARAGAELKVMAAIETKLPGQFTTGLGERICPEEWGADTLPLGSEELSFALGQGGSTRKKLAKASGCILEYVGNVAYMAGTKAERRRCRDYITWLVQQRTGRVYVDITTRDDASAVSVPQELTGLLKGSTLRDIEYDTETFCFLEGDVDSSDRLLIFGHSKGRRAAEKKVKELICLRPRQSTHDEQSEWYRAENYMKSEVRIPLPLVGLVESERFQPIQTASGARLTLQGQESVLLEGYDHQVAVAKRQLHDYMYNIKVEEEFFVPKDVPFHVLTAKSPDGKPSVLEEVRNQTRVRVKVVPEEKKVVFAGLFSVTANAKRELQTFFGSFLTHTIHLDRSQLEKVGGLGKNKFPKMQNFRHMSAASINKDNNTLTLSGTPDAVAEAHACVDSLFTHEGWQTPHFEVFSLKHAMKSCTRAGAALSGGAAGGGAEEARPTGRPGKAAEILQLEEKDSAFILGRGGKTKHKISRVSGAQLELHEQTNTVEIIGTDEERRRARKYVDLVRMQRVGPVSVTQSQDDGDLTMINVPHNCVGFVTGSQGNFLRATEEEWGTLMFFCDYQGPTGKDDEDTGGIERLAIFGSRAGRTGAELKVMAAIETKIPGYFTRNLGDACSNEEWGQDTLPLADEELSFALGKDGSTRKKLARASGCILEYVGNIAFMAGSLAARRRVRDYLGWLMKQRTGTVYVDTEGRNDATWVDIPGNLEGVESVFKSITLRSLEQETKTFCFLEGSASKSERLLIFSVDKAGREKAKAQALEKIKERLQNLKGRNYDSRHKNDRDSYGGYHNQGYDNSWSRDSYGDRGYDKWDDNYYDDAPRKKGGRGGGYNDDYYGNSRGGGGNGGYGYNDYSGHHGGGRGGDYHYRDWDQRGGSESYEGGGGGGGGDHAEANEVTDTFSLRGDISVHVVIQTGPSGEDPVIEEVETATGTRLTLLRDKGVVQIQGAASKVAQAKKLLQQFADKFVTCKIQMHPQITNALANKVNHYIKPMPWISAAEIDEQRDLLKIQGHQDSVDQTFKVLREVYRDHNLELTDADVIMRKKGDDLSVTTRTLAGGRCVEILRVSELDAAFILGKAGKTKHKIARVSGATLELQERNNTVEISGGEPERRKARKYVELVRAQRAGPVNVDESHDDGDLTMIAVPHSCVGFVTGTQGNFLRTCEEEWGTLMFFCDYQGPSADGNGVAERLAIFGDLHGRCGAELKVMAAIETKIPGYYTTNLGDTHSEEYWGTDTLPLQEEQLSYALGKKGSTRKKLAKASGVILEYVGNVAFFAGPMDARMRGRDYLSWLCDQVYCKTGRINIDPTTRDDVTLVPVPKDCIGYVMGDKRKTLSRLEEDWETLIFFVDSNTLQGYQDVEGIAIFGAARGRAGTELKVMGAVETKLPQFFTRGVGDYHCPQPWGVDTLPLAAEELSFALGKDGSTRRKLARASGCILEYVGNVAYMAGSIEERLRAREYLRLLMRQRVGTVTVDADSRSDVTVVRVPEEMRGWTKAATLREVEKETGTFIFFQGDQSTSGELLVCGHAEQDRNAAVAILEDFLSKGASQPKQRKKAAGAQHSRKDAYDEPPPPPARGGGGGRYQRDRDRYDRQPPPQRDREQQRRPARPAQNAAQGDRRRPPPAGRRVQADESSDEYSRSASEMSGSQSASSSAREDQRRSPVMRQRPREPDAKRRQWASEESGSESDEEIVNYW